jgi:MFS family permease
LIQQVKKMGKNEQSTEKNTQLALLGAAHSLNHSLFVITPPLMAMIMNTLGVTKLIIGSIATIASFIYGAGSLIGGPLGDKIGEAKTIILCLTLSGLSTFIMLAAASASNTYAYIMALVLIAAWASFYHPTANCLISRVFTSNVGETMGLHGVGGTLGTVLTPTIAWFIGSIFGWAWAFVTFGVLSMLLALPFLKAFKKTNCEVTNTSSILNALKIRELWILLIFNVAIGLFMKGVELYFPIYLSTNRNIDEMWASIALTLVLAAGVPGQWLGGKAADRFGSKRVLIVTSFGVCVSLLSILFVPVYVVGIALFIVFYGLSFYGHQPALNSLTGLLSPENQRGAVYGIFFFTSFGIGSLSQTLAGYIADAYGLDLAFGMFAAFAFAALLLSFKLPSNKK